MTWLLVLTLAQVPPTSPPPLVPLEEPALPVPAPPPPGVEVARSSPSEPLMQTLQFAPVSLGGLFFSLEYERAVLPSVSVVAVAGAGLLGQYGAEAGLRWYPAETSLTGLFLDGRLSTFGLFTGDMFLIGPAVTIGYQWQINKRLVVSIGGGATLWYPAVHAQGRSGFTLFSGLGSDASLFLLPGIYQPPQGELGVQPTLRLNLGLAL